MNDHDTLKALFQNALLMAFADGVFHPLQREFLKDLMEHAGIDDAMAREWRAELVRGTLAFRPVQDRADALEVARVAIGAAAADGEFHSKEKTALLELGKALGIDRRELQALVHETFGKDVLGAVFRGRAPGPSAGAWVITDDFVELEALLEVASGFAPRTLSVREAVYEPPFDGIALFHVAETRAASEERFGLLARRHPRARLIFVTERAQAYQIGYLLDAGAAGCLIAPVYPEEIDGLLARIASPEA